MRLRAAGLHALGSHRNALVFQRLLGGALSGDQVGERIGARLGYEQVDDRIVRAGGTGVGKDVRRLDAPPVPDPHRDVATDRQRFGAEVEGESARFLAGTVGKPR